MGDAHGRVGAVDVLAALARRAVGVDAQFLGVDVDGDRVVDFGDDEDGGERGVAALVGVEGRDAHQAVDADLLLQVAEGELALVAHGDALDPGLLAGQDVGDLGLEAQALAEAQVHAQQDLGPVLALGAAGAGVDAQEGVAGVAVAVEVMLDLGLLDVSCSSAIFCSSSRQQLGVLVDQLQVGVHLLDGRAQLLVDLDEAVQDLFLLRQPGRLLRLAPDGGIGQLGVDLFDLFGLLGYFKETPEGRRFFSSIRLKRFLICTSSIG